MSTVNTSSPNGLKIFGDKHIGTRHFGSNIENAHELIRKDQDR